MTRRATAVIALSLAGVLAAGCSGTATAPQTPPAGGGEKKAPYKLGAVVSLTGTYAGLGQPEKNVLDMEVARINAAGGINGHPLEVVALDDATDPKKAVSDTTKLLDEEKVLAVLGATGSGQTMAMRTEIDRAQVPQVSMAGATVITKKFDKWVFQTPWSNVLVLPFELKYMQSKGVKKLALLSDSTAFGKDGIEVAKANLGTYGITVAAEETFNPGDTDMTAQLTKIKAAKPDAILLVNAGKEAVIAVKGAAQLGIKVPIFGTHGNARKEFIDGAGPAAEGFTFAAGKILIPDAYGKGTEPFKVATDFVDRYTKKYGAAPSTFAGHAYDALYLTVEAMKRLPEGFASSQLRDEIEKTSGFVGIGGTFTFSPTDHNGMTEKDLVMYKVENGKWVLAQ
ncbi:MAG TPA: ABC transporter substrate-binding protein [Coriobacteriia bacterium]|jgi:branched-chain amino acid transport system substrate-binding protein